MIKKNKISKRIMVLILTGMVTFGTFSQPVDAAHKHQFYTVMTWKVFKGNKTIYYTHFRCKSCDYEFVGCTGGSRKF